MHSSQFLCPVLWHLYVKGLQLRVVIYLHTSLLEMQNRILESLKSYIQKERSFAPRRMSQLLMRLGSIKTLSVVLRQRVAENQSQVVNNIIAV